MSDKEAPVGEVVELTSEDTRYCPVDFAHYKIYHGVLIEI